MTDYHQIRAVYDESMIQVYQAYSAGIAEEAVRLGTFGQRFKLTRMTWIKPSFLWMMYRSGWGLKENQEHILAIQIKRSAFDDMLQHAVLSSYHENQGISYREWQKRIRDSEIRIQWDPERDIYGNALDYRSIQIGIRGESVRKYVNDWITEIRDITDYVTDLRNKKEQKIDITGLLPEEKIYFGKKQD
ncbi:MAG: DUF4291 domain-containing protein [Oscillospiraceae bacterium]|nr:DUF4291 domain-containing protein [Oscillospiraceae bacterium]